MYQKAVRRYAYTAKRHSRDIETMKAKNPFISGLSYLGRYKTRHNTYRLWEVFFQDATDTPWYECGPSVLITRPSEESYADVCKLLSSRRISSRDDLLFASAFHVRQG